MKAYVYIGAGGFVGAIIRYMVKGVQLNGLDMVIPVQTLAVNLVGAVLLAFILTIALEVWDFDNNLRLGVTTGLMGALTTFSTLCKETVELLRTGNVFEAIGYVLLSVLLGFACAWAGTRVARRLGHIKKKRLRANGGMVNLESDVD